jgi:ribonuclease P protein component
MQPNRFKKNERLRSQKVIGALFAQGQVVIKYPFRAVFLVSANNGFPPAEVMMSVSKKRFKRANQRHLIRRRMKEAYRLQKSKLYISLNQMNIHLAVALIYLPKEESDYLTIYKNMGKLFDKLIALLQKETPLSSEVTTQTNDAPNSLQNPPVV